MAPRRTTGRRSYPDGEGSHRRAPAGLVVGRVEAAQVHAGGEAAVRLAVEEGHQHAVAFAVGARGRRSRTALCGDGLRVAGRSALRCHTALCHLGRSAVLLLLQPAAVVEQAREAAMRALTGGRARGRRRCNEALRLLTVL